MLTESVVHTDAVEVVTGPRTADQVRVREVGQNVQQQLVRKTQPHREITVTNTRGLKRKQGKIIIKKMISL